MGVIAVIRQTFWETQYSLKRIAFEKRNPTGVPFFMHEGTESLLRSLPPNSSFPVWMEPGSCLMMRKAIELGEEFSLPPPILIATGQEWRRPDLSLSPEHHYALPLVFPTPSKTAQRGRLGANITRPTSVLGFCPRACLHWFLRKRSPCPSPPADAIQVNSEPI